MEQGVLGVDVKHWAVWISRNEREVLPSFGTPIFKKVICLMEGISVPQRSVLSSTKTLYTPKNFIGKLLSCQVTITSS